MKEITRIEMNHAYTREQYADSIKRGQQQVLLELKHEQELANERTDRNIAMGIGIGILLLAGGLWSRLLYVRKVQRVIKKERDRSDELLLNILPSEIAVELKRDGKAAARRYENVTILFTDFKEFTRISEEMEATQLVDEINACFTQFDRICDKFGIEKIKTIGDAYMAAGGLPVRDERAPVKVIEAALEMQKFMNQRAIQRAELELPRFQMRAGVHTGSVVAGIVGLKKFQYDIWGDAVNTASRMESSGEVGKVNISETTYDLVKDEFNCEYRGEIEAKGKGKVKMYFVKG